MADIQLVKKLNQYNKDILTVQDLQQILAVKPVSLRTKISRLVDKQVLQRVGHGLYSVFGKTVIPEEVAPQLYYPSYLSLKTVLSRTGIIDQIPQQVYLVTPRKTYQTKILDTPIIYRKLKQELFFGYFIDQSVPTAYPEKALLDLAYFISLGKASCNWDEVDFDRLDKKRLKQFLKRFPNQVGKFSSLSRM